MLLQDETSAHRLSAVIAIFLLVMAIFTYSVHFDEATVSFVPHTLGDAVNSCADALDELEPDLSISPPRCTVRVRMADSYAFLIPETPIRLSSHPPEIV